jgi:uncharacterized protein YggT (Ycf19 family)
MIPRMDDLGLRVALLARILVPFLFMMASVYLATHVLFERVISSPRSQVLAFFTIVTSPLTRPVRMFVPPGMTETRVRAIALVVYLLLWMATDWLSRALGPAVSG